MCWSQLSSLDVPPHARPQDTFAKDEIKPSYPSFTLGKVKPQPDTWIFNFHSLKSELWSCRMLHNVTTSAWAPQPPRPEHKDISSIQKTTRKKHPRTKTNLQKVSYLVLKSKQQFGRWDRFQWLSLREGTMERRVGLRSDPEDHGLYMWRCAMRNRLFARWKTH